MTNPLEWAVVKFLSPEEAALQPQMTDERFYGAKTFDEFVTSANAFKDLWENARKKPVKFDDVTADYIAEITALTTKSGEKWHLLCITEDWCLDAVSSTTPVANLCETLDSIDFRVFERDKNLDLIDAHLTNNGRSIPVLILYDQDWNEKAWWGPRPEELQRWYMTLGKTLPNEEKYKYARTWYVRDNGVTTLKEVTGMVLTSITGQEVLTTDENR